MIKQNITNKTLYIFDWDGTVMDSATTIVASILWAAKKHEVTTTAEQAKNIIGLGLPEAMQTLFPSHPDKWEDIRTSYGAHYVQHSKQTQLFAGIRELLTTLKAQGKTLAVATGKSRKGLDRVLDESQLGSLFTATRGADETKSKPNPLMLQEILEQTGVSVADAVMIGDSSYDMHMAQNISMDRIAVTYGVHTPDVLQKFQPMAMVDDVDALQAILCGPVKNNSCTF